MVSGGRGRVTMSAGWPQLRESWLTPELALDNWRERITRVEAQETAHFAELPYVLSLIHI